MRLRLDPSDLVQETFLEAHRDFPRFEGGTEREVVAWLRRILVRNLADQARRQKAGLRDYRRQESLEAVLELYQSPAEARTSIPLLAALTESSESLMQRASTLLIELKRMMPNEDFSIMQGESFAGGGSMPAWPMAS